MSLKESEVFEDFDTLTSAADEADEGIKQRCGTDVISELKELMKRFTVETAPKYQKRIKDSLETLQVLPEALPFKVNGYQENDKKQAVIGRIIYTGVYSLIRAVGPIMEAIIEHDFDIQDYLKGVRETKEIKNAKLIEYKKGLKNVGVVAPSELDVNAAIYVRTFEINQMVDENGKPLAKGIKEAEIEKMKYEIYKDYAEKKKQEKEFQMAKSRFESEMLEIEHIMDEELIEEIILNALEYAKNTILGKLMSAVAQYQFLIDKLNYRTNVLADGKVYHLSYNERHLSGMIKIMKELYCKASLSVFSQMLTDLVTYTVDLEVSNKNPYRAVVEMDRQLAHWMQLDAFNKCMSMDILFTICLVRSYHGSSECSKLLIQYVTDVLIEEETEGRVDVKTDKSKPMRLYTTVATWIREHYERGRKLNHYSKRDAANSNTGNSGYSIIRSNQGELAAAGEVINLDVERAKRVEMMTLAAGPYNREIKREDLIKVADRRDPNKFHAYTATLVVCSCCSIKENREHLPMKCSTMKCNRCGLFGHHVSNCKQSM
jgi:hypothetical protein